MKDFDKPIPQSEEIVIVKQAEEQQTPIFRNVSIHKGHTMFEVNMTTGEIVPATYESTVANFKGGIKRKILCKENCLYIPCLNKKNAKKKLAKYIIENIKFSNEESHQSKEV